jgi:transposase-like protein
MFDTSDDTKVRRPRRIEVLMGPERRRDWPDTRKIAIAESLTPGVNVSEIARRHEINPHQLFGWRRKFGAEAVGSDRVRSAVSAAAAICERGTAHLRGLEKKLAIVVSYRPEHRDRRWRSSNVQAAMPVNGVNLSFCQAPLPAIGVARGRRRSQ